MRDCVLQMCEIKLDHRSPLQILSDPVCLSVLKTSLCVSEGIPVSLSPTYTLADDTLGVYHDGLNIAVCCIPTLINLIYSDAYVLAYHIKMKNFPSPLTFHTLASPFNLCSIAFKHFKSKHLPTKILYQLQVISMSPKTQTEQVIMTVNNTEPAPPPQVMRYFCPGCQRSSCICPVKP